MHYRRCLRSIVYFVPECHRADRGDSKRASLRHVEFGKRLSLGWSCEPVEYHAGANRPGPAMADMTALLERFATEYHLEHYYSNPEAQEDNFKPYDWWY